MLHKFITPPTKYGVKHCLIIDDSAKTIKGGYNPYNYTDFIKVTSKKELERIAEHLKKEGYTEIF